MWWRNSKWMWLVLVLMVWGIELSGKLSQRARLVVCDVGQGSGALLIVGGWQTLFDVGPDNGMMVGCLERYMKWGDKEIEVVVISHWDKDHSGGLAQIEKFYKIKNVFGPKPGKGSDEQKIYSKYLMADDILRMGKFDFEILSPDNYSLSLEGDENANSVVGVLSYKDKKILMTGDADEKVLKRLVWRGAIGLVTVMVVPHHGSKTGTPRELIEAAWPREAVISVGKNSYGHPSQQVLGMMDEYKIQTERTDKKGDVVIELDE